MSRPPELERLLVIRHGAFGDLMQVAGALRDLREGHPGAAITLLTGPAYQRLMERCPHVDAVLTDARRPYHQLGPHLALRRQLRELAPQRVYDLQGSDRTALYRRLLLPGVPWYRKGGGLPASAPDVRRYQALLREAGLQATHCLRPNVAWMADDVVALLTGAGIDGDYIVLIPGCAARHPHKRWPHYAELARALIERGHTVVTAPGPDELELARDIPGVCLTGNGPFLDWFQLAGVLAGARYVIGNDTGPSHLASCLDTPGLALFGPHTSPARTGILRPGFEAMAVRDLNGLSVDQVLETALARLAGPPAPGA